MTISISANVAKSVEGKPNTLCLPEFGVVQLRVTKGEKGSKSYRPQGSKTTREPGDQGGDTFHFAPGTSDKVKLEYVLENPFNAIETGKLELFRRFDQTPLWTRELKPEELSDGEHELKFGDSTDWDGKVEGAKKTELPDEYLSVAHSPYKLKLSVKGAGRPTAREAFTYLQILIGEVKLEYGPKEVLPTSTTQADHRKVYEELTGQALCKDDEERKVVLPSDCYKAGHSMFDNSLFDQYEALWGDGPLIPLFAAVKVLDSGDQKVDAPLALGKTRFMWDWEDKAKTTGQAWADKALDYEKQKTKPKGMNCHVDRGGKRGPGAAPVFPSQAGYDPADTLQDAKFPFKVEQVAKKRKWAAYSYPWTKGTLKGKTGVLFQPSRMAGDRYKVHVYACTDVDDKGVPTLDVDDDGPLKLNAKLTAATGIFEVWRRMHFVKYFQKTSACSDLGAANMAAFFKPAYVELKDVTGGKTLLNSGQWDPAFDTAVSNHQFLKLDQYKPMIASGSQHGKGPDGVYFRTRTRYRRTRAAEACIANFNGLSNAHKQAIRDATAQAAAAVADATVGGARATAKARAKNKLKTDGYSDPDAEVLAEDIADELEALDQQMANDGMNTDAGYAQICENGTSDLLTALFDQFFSTARPGSTLFQVRHSHDKIFDIVGGITTGLAADFPSGDDTMCAFLSMGDNPTFGPKGRIEQTGAHEFGHHFFLPHPPNTAECQDYAAHEDGTTTCLMTYEDVDREVCGFCRLRLRGWSKAALDPDGDKNKKT